MRHAAPVWATALDISAGGACVLCEQSVEVFSLVKCCFYFPAVPAPVPVLGQVRWIEPHPAGEGPFRAGVSFLA